MSKPYVLTWRSDIDPGSIKIVGPFDKESQAASWGRVWSAAHQSNPCWQVISLELEQFVFGGNRPEFVIKVETPGTPEASA